LKKWWPGWNYHLCKSKANYELAWYTLPPPEQKIRSGMNENTKKIAEDGKSY
jgi:hypothetical protein